MNRELCEAFVLLADLALADGAGGLSKRAGCWERQIGDEWWAAINGHNAPTDCTRATAIPAFSAYVEFNGWPAGVLNPYGGVLAAGESANEETFCAAVRAEIARVKEGR